jgi:hypothetical protein
MWSANQSKDQSNVGNLESVACCGHGQRFHLEGNFLPEGYFGVWKEIWKEIAFARKSEGNFVLKKKILKRAGNNILRQEN